MGSDFYVSEFKVTVLSEGEPPDPGSNLLDLEYLITQGPCVGTVTYLRTTPVNAARMRGLLEEMDSDMSVFDLVDDDDAVYDPTGVEEEDDDLDLINDDLQDDD